jgi:hypothetical protein
MPPEPEDMHADDGAFDRADGNPYSICSSAVMPSHSPDRSDAWHKQAADPCQTDYPMPTRLRERQTPDRQALTDCVTSAVTVNHLVIPPDIRLNA